MQLVRQRLEYSESHVSRDLLEQLPHIAALAHLSELLDSLPLHLEILLEPTAVRSSQSLAEQPHL